MSLSKENIAEIYSLTPMQEAMYYFYKLDNKSRAYFQQSTTRFSGVLDRDAVTQSLQMLIDRHDALRTVFTENLADRILQVVLRKRAADIAFVDMSGQPGLDARLDDYRESLKNRSFDLKKDLLMRLSVVKTGEQSHELVWSFHHIVADGWSTAVFIDEFFKIYRCLVEGLPVNLPAPVPFKTFISWFEQRDKALSLAFWKSALAGYDQRVSLPKKKATQPSYYQSASYTTTIDSQLAERLKTYATRHRATVYGVVEALWGLLVARYNGTNDVVFGTVVSGRPSHLQGIDRMVGLFINTIPTRVCFDEQMTFAHLLVQSRELSMKKDPHCHVSLADIQKQSTAGGELFDHIIAFENFPVQTNGNASGARFPFEVAMAVTGHEGQTTYDLDVTFVPGEQLTMVLAYNASVYDHQTIEQLGQRFVFMVTQVVSNDDMLIQDIELLDEADKHLLLCEWNNTAVDYPRDACVQQLFEQQATVRPGATAVVLGSQAMTYGALHEKTNKLAHYLQEYGTSPETLVGICMERSIDMVVAMLAIQKAGGAYLPIDPSNPAGRITFMVEDSGCKIVLTSSQVLNTLPDFANVTVLCIDDDATALEVQKRPATPVLSDVASNNLAYVIYTSGTTGNPKGVMIEHRSLVNLCLSMREAYRLTPSDAILQFASYTFDMSVEEIFPALTSGATLVLSPREIKESADYFRQYCSDHGVTILNLPPVFWTFVTDENVFDTLRSVRLIAVGGDELKLNSLLAWQERYGESIELWNAYGPTEYTVNTTLHRFRKDAVVSIGKALNNTRVHILDSNQRLLPPGMAGELCIAGDGLARGYLKRPELTAEKFIINPFSPQGTGRLYRTGDLARYFPDGSIEFLGRIDDQVKIRGFRVELGEIEQTINKIEGISASVVVAKDDGTGNKYLAAYIVMHADHQPVTHDAIREIVRQSLPDYMVPARFMTIGAIPLTSNGKVNKKALPELDDQEIETLVMPGTETEKQLARLWSDILGVEASRIGIDSDFFALGGHSLKAVTLVARIQRTFKKELKLDLVFDKPTIGELARELDAALTTTYQTIPKASKKEYYNLSSAQQRLFVLHQMNPSSTSYNMPAAFEIEGELDVARLEETFKKLIERHESLRTSFCIVDGVPRQVIHDDVTFSISVNNNRGGATIHDQFTAFVRPFDLSTYPLMRVAMGVGPGEVRVLFIDFHHIITDGVSLNTFMHELPALHTSQTLPPLTLQYKDFAEWQGGRWHEQRMQKAEAYWTGIFSDQPAVLDLPTDSVRPATRDLSGAETRFVIPAARQKQLHDLATQQGTTMYATLLAAINVLLFKLSGQDDIVVGTSTSGRTHADVQGIFGMFVNTLAIRTRFAGDFSFKQLLHATRSGTIGAFEHQDFPLEALLNKLSLSRDTSRNPLFDVFFILQNIESGEFEVPGARVKMMNLATTTAKFDLAFEAHEATDGIHFRVEYCTALFGVSAIDRLVAYFTYLIDTVCDDATIALDDIQLAPHGELLDEVGAWANSHPFPSDKTIIGLFEDMAKSLPHASAIVTSTTQITYAGLLDRATRVATSLASLGVGPGTVVAVYGGRTLTTLTGIMGVMKAGGAYLPVDANYPADRVSYMITNAGVRHVVCGGGFPLEGLGVDVVDVDQCLESASDDGALVPATPDDLAYIIYTSGTTGQPKGVKVRHRGVVNTLVCRRDEYQIGPGDVCMQLFSPSFDGFVTSFFTPLVSGAAVLWLDDSQTTDMGQVAAAIGHHRVTHFICVPGLFREIIKRVDSRDASCLRSVTLAGDKLTLDLVHDTAARLPGVELAQEYGVTEASVMSTMFRQQQTAQALRIGRPVWNTRVYILDKHLHMQPAGVPGEMYVGGAGVAEGYINNDELTARKFIASPFVAGERLYATGDRARRHVNGTIEFMGRTDTQVKVRGFRIEPGEVETCLNRLEGVGSSVVVARDDSHGNKVLVAYVVGSTPGQVPGPAELRAGLRRSLADYMVPSLFVNIEAIPLTPNGKVDTRALPDLTTLTDSKAEHELPSNDIEEALLGLWSEVLGIDRGQVSTTADFFLLGGHSLSAIGLVARIQKQLGKELSLDTVFANPTIQLLARQVAGTRSTTFAAIPPAPRKQYYELSSAQRRQFVLHEMDKHDLSYNMPDLFELEAPVEKERLEEILQTLVARHESLRTSFVMVDGVPQQYVHDTLDVVVDSISCVSHEQLSAAFTAFVRPFDLSVAPLMRVSLVTGWDDRQFIFIDFHHIIADGVTVFSLLKELWKLREGQVLPPLMLQYKDYAEWQHSDAARARVKDMESFWMKRFEHLPPVLDLPTDFTRPALKSHEGATERFHIPGHEAKILANIANEQGTTLFTTLLAMINILLSKISGQNDIVVGSSTSGRNHIDLEHIAGMFVNTLALRNTVVKELSFKEFLVMVKQSTLEAFQNQDYQFDELLNKLTIERDTSRNPLFDVFFLLQNFEKKGFDFKDIGLKTVSTNNTISKFDLSFDAYETDRGIEFEIEYCTRLFKVETIRRIAGYLGNIVGAVCHDPGVTIGSISLLSAAERATILGFNLPPTPLPCQSIVDLLGRLPAGLDGQVAVECEGKELTHGQLRELSDRVAANLVLASGVGREEPVGVYMERSESLVVVLLGILKSGAAYVPLEVDLPDNRVRTMIQSAGVKTVVTNVATPLAGTPGVDFVTYDALLAQPSGHWEPPRISASDLAYVLFTSGSTGEPKGVMVEHHSLLDYALTCRDYFAISSSDRVIMQSSVAFDTLVEEVYPALLAGGRVVVVRQGGKDIETMLRLVETGRATVLSTTPLVVAELNKYPATVAKLRVLISGGDKLKASHVSQIAGTVAVYNTYGPTESTVCATYHRVTTPDDAPLIGKPINNRQVYVLDAFMQLQPIGMEGELYIGGQGVARGYTRADLTARAFVGDPFNPGQKLYRTGDRVRWTAGGTIEFIDRADNQVKIRGYRIEKQEIELCIASHAGVREVVVTDRSRDNGEKYLCAYYITSGTVHINDIREHVAVNLPSYMVPAHFVELDVFPLLPSGKVNLHALPDPSTMGGSTPAGELPGTAVEQLLADTWGEVLGRGTVGIHDNYFSLGGDSIKAIQLQSRLRARGYKLELKHLFQYPTIAGLAGRMELVNRQSDQSMLTGTVPLSPIQQQFFMQQATDRHHYNQSVLLAMDKGLSLDHLRSVVGALCQHHDALRSTFVTRGGSVVQEVRGHDFEPRVEEHDLCADASPLARMDTLNDELQRGFDLERGPLFAAAVYRLPQGDRLLLAAHHLVVDGVSWRVILEDLETLVGQVVSGGLPGLPPKTDSYKYWVNSLSQFATSPELVRQVDYWKRLEQTPVDTLPTDHRGQPCRQKHLQTVSASLSPALTASLVGGVNEAYGTQANDILLSGLVLAFHRVFGVGNVLLSVEGHGREAIANDLDLSRTVGWFTSVYPVIVQIDKPGDLSHLVRSTKETLHHIPMNGVGHQVLRHVSTSREMTFGLHPVVEFNYLGQFGTDTGTGFFRHADEQAGKQVGGEVELDKDLIITAIIPSDTLSISIDYNTTRYEATTITRLLNEYVACLERIENHCANIDQKILTPSDLSDEELTLDELDEIKNLLGDM